MVTLQEAKHLDHGDVLIEKVTGEKWRVSGRPITKKTKPSEIRVPVAHGLYTHSYLGSGNLNDFEFESKMTKQRVHKNIKLHEGITCNRVTLVRPIPGINPEFAGRKGQKGTIVKWWTDGKAVVHWDNQPNQKLNQVIEIDHLKCEEGKQKRKR